MGTVPFFRPTGTVPGDRTEWDIVYLDGKPLPGKCTCVVEPIRDVKTVKEKDKDGVNQKDNGYAGAKVEITVTIWEQEQLDEFNDLLPTFHPRKPGAEIGPVSLEHPAALLMGVTGIRTKKIKVPEPTDQGILVILISAEEWFPASGVKNSNKKAAPKTGGTGGNDEKSDFNVAPPDPAGPGANFP